MQRLTSPLVKQKQHVLLSNCQQALPSWYSLLDPTFCNVNWPQMFHFEENPQPVPWCASHRWGLLPLQRLKVCVEFVYLQRDQTMEEIKWLSNCLSNYTIRLWGLWSYWIKSAQYISVSTMFKMIGGHFIIHNIIELRLLWLRCWGTDDGPMSCRQQPPPHPAPHLGLNANVVLTIWPALTFSFGCHNFSITWT